MGTLAPNEAPACRGILANVWERTGSLRAGIIAGALCGAVFGGVGGRIVMRIIAQIDQSTDGVETDFATVGDRTVGGSFTLLVLSTLAGVLGGLIYVAVRRWLPVSPLVRAVFFGLLMAYGPGTIAVSEVDLQIFEPALPILAMFVLLMVLYGVCVAPLTDHLHPQPSTRPGPRMERAAGWLIRLAAVGICAMAVFGTYHVYDGAGSCLSADRDTGGCAVRATDR